MDASVCSPAEWGQPAGDQRHEAIRGVSHRLQGGAPRRPPSLLSHGLSDSAPPVQGPCLSTSVFPLCYGVRLPTLPCAVASPIPPCPRETQKRGVHGSRVHAGSPSAQATACAVLATPYKSPRGCPSKTQCPAKNPALLGRGRARGHCAAPKTRARVPEPAQGKQAAGGKRNPLDPENRRTTGRTALCKEDAWEGWRQLCMRPRPLRLGQRPSQAPEKLAQS